MNDSASPLDDEPPGPMVERLAVEEVQPRQKSRPKPTHLRLFEREQPTEAPPAPPAAIPAPAAPDRSVATLEVFQILARVLAARALVFIFGWCGFVIALIAALRESREVLFVFGAWMLLTVIPLIVLDVVTRRRE